VQVYVDESERRDFLLCAVLVRTDVGPVRRAVRAMCQAGQRRVRFAKEGPARRRAVLSALAELGVQARSAATGDAGWSPMIDEVVRLGR